jgi:cytochrome P450
MGVASPPAVPDGVISRLRSDLRWQRAARGRFPPGELAFSMRRTREFERQPLPLLLRLYDAYGPVFSIRLIYAPVVFALGPAANHYITVSGASNFRWRDGGMGDLIPLLGDGLLTTDGDYHRRARQIMLPAFHREQVAAATDTMVDETARAMQAWRPGTRLDLYSWTRHLALRIALRALFGFDPDRSTHDADLAEVFENVLGYWGREYTMQMLRGPGSPWRRMVRARALLDRVIFDEIERRRTSGERGSDILSLLLDAEDEDGSRLSVRELRDQVMTLLFAGHDTTTSTVTFLFYELARKPDEIAPLLAEQDGDGRPRLDMVVDETLRMYPPAWIGPRRSIDPFELHGVSVPGGVLVNYCSWASHHRRCSRGPGSSGPSASRPASGRSCPRAPTCRSAAARAPASGCASACSRSRP